MDPQAAGRELSVANVFSGHFLREGDQLQVTLEVMDTESNRVLWRDTLGAKEFRVTCAEDPNVGRRDERKQGGELPGA